MYVDDIKLVAKSGKELETQLQTDRIYSQDIGMEFGREKYAMQIMRSRKRNNGRNKYSKSGNNQKAWSKGSQQLLGNIGSRCLRTSEERNIL